MSFFRLLLIGTIGSGLAGGGRAGDPAAVEFFESRVRPVLVEHCHACHSATKSKAGLRLDSRAGLLKGGDSGPAIVPGDPGKSRLIAAIKYGDVELQMPPRAKLPDRAIADIESWVKNGAAWPDDGKAADAGPEKFDLAARKKAHWCWQPVKSPTVPKGDRDPIDVLIREKLSAGGLAPSPAADAGTLLRRLSFALTGLPPTAEEVEQFIKSPDRQAAVDRMLASPRFGERWARHWLDLVRYSETRGHEFDYTQPNAWQYRDYVIRALNADVPYDQFVREHVAGDLLPDPRHGPGGINESVLATGFWWLGEQVHSPVELRLDEADRVDNQIDVFGKTFLGITLACARCHDHKFDAISTADYYSFASVLASNCFRQTRFETEFAEREAANKLLGHRAASAAGRHAALGELLAKAIADAPVTVRGAPRRTPDSVVIVDYQTVKPAEWLPDGVGIVSVRPGDWLPGAPIATEHAAAADPAWFDHSVHKESQVEPGDLGKVTRAGRSIRTPSVML
ncbi:MAG: DUF1549 domain-containing protein, partial [Gemmataceae bacterium]|nr:DUF1549 domain-containing protein [Gemmataceae bacterium]